MQFINLRGEAISSHERANLSGASRTLRPSKTIGLSVYPLFVVVAGTTTAPGAYIYTHLSRDSISSCFGKLRIYLHNATVIKMQKRFSLAASLQQHTRI